MQLNKREDFVCFEVTTITHISDLNYPKIHTTMRLPHYACLLLSMTVFAHAQTKYCCTPTQWESVNMIADARDTAGNTTKPLYTDVSTNQIVAAKHFFKC